MVDPYVQFWFEDYGCEDAYGYNPPPPCPLVNGQPDPYQIYPLDQPAVSVGDLVRVFVNATNGAYYFYNITTGFGSNIHMTTLNNNNTGLSADFIVEEIGCPDRCTYGSFSNVVFENLEAGTPSGVNYLASWNYRRIDLCVGNTGLRIAEPTGVDSSTYYGFQVSGNTNQSNNDCPPA